MELFSAEAESIQKRVSEWLGHPNFELEATFGNAFGEVDAVTFLNVAKRLRAKGYVPTPPEDRMTITTPDHLRLSLTTMGVIRTYCEDDAIAGKPYTAIIKDRAFAEAQVDLDDYGARVKLRREIPLAREDSFLKAAISSWPQQRKAFRILRRWTFEKDGIRVDMSIVRSTAKDKRGSYRWQTKFKDQDIAAAKATYEIEVELLPVEGDSPEAGTKRLIRGMGEVLRGIQKHSILIRKSVKEKVLEGYKEITGSSKFRGPNLRVLLKKNFSRERTRGEANIRDGYNVTDKADGLRVLAYVDGKGDLYLIDMAMNVYRTGLRRPELRLSLVDGEWVTQTKDDPPKPVQLFLAFDIFYATDKRPVSNFPFQPGAVVPARARAPGAAGEPEGTGAAAGAPQPKENSRHFQLTEWVKIWNQGAGPKLTVPGITENTKLLVAAKEFIFARAGDDSIFRAAERVLATHKAYYTDGLIFTPNALPLPQEPEATFMEQLKWKPPQDNTIDFLAVTEKEAGSKTLDKISQGEKPDTHEFVSYKTLRLFVGGRTENPRDTVLDMKELPREEERGAKKGDYRPVLFTPSEFPNAAANICYLEIERDEDTGEEYVKTEEGEPIQDKSIVEMAYDPARPPGWRWIPKRVRMDKTERFQRGVIVRTLNGSRTAEETWVSIYDPISVSMICRGTEDPTEEELAAIGQTIESRKQIARRYFDRNEQTDQEQHARGLKKFHTRWIKERILYRVGLMSQMTEAEAAEAGIDMRLLQQNPAYIEQQRVKYGLPAGATKEQIVEAARKARRAAVVAARPGAPAQQGGGGKSLVDLACGMAGDLHIWRRLGAGFVLGVDNATKNIMGAEDSAYKRYMSVAIDAGGLDQVEPMVFAIGDASRPLIDGTAAGENPADADILRAVFGRHPPVGAVPQFVKTYAEGRLKTKADCVACMFAIHYFFESKEKLDGLIRNIVDTLKVGGYFIGCCFDGGTVFEKLKRKRKGEALVGMEAKTELWRITKGYDADEMPEGDAGFGLPISVFFKTIGAEHQEYLVPFKLLEEKMRLAGCELLSGEELREAGLAHSSSLFGPSYEMAEKAGQKFPMGDAAKDFSFMNRWFIFKRKREEALAEAAVAEAAAVTAAQRTNAAVVANGVAAPEVAGRDAAVARAAEANVAAATALRAAAATPGGVATPAAADLAAAATAAANAATPARAPQRNMKAPGAAADRTIAVAPGSAAAPAALEAAGRQYAQDEVFLFYSGAAASKDILKIGDKGAAQWIAPSAPFQIEDEGVVYPTLEHYLAGMRVKIGAKRPDLAASIFGREGTIHQEFNNQRLLETNAGARPLSEKRDQELIAAEIAKVRDTQRAPSLKKYGVVVDEAAWLVQRDAVLEEGLRQRWTKDARFRKIVEAARGLGKYLLYYTPGATTSNLGGVRSANTGRIQGENRIGKAIMKLAGYPEAS